MFSLEFIFFFFFFSTILVLLIMKQFLSLLMYLEFCFLLKFLVLGFKSFVFKKKTFFLMLLLMVAVGATIGLSLMMKEARLSSFFLLKEKIGF